MLQIYFFLLVLLCISHSFADSQTVEPEIEIEGQLVDDLIVPMATSRYVTTRAGVSMPRIIYGTAWKKESTTELVIKAIQAGFTGIDTACQPRHYREDLVGEALERLNVSRNSLFIQTKFTSVDGQDPDNIPYDPNADLKEQVLQSFSVSQKNLRTDYVDSLVLHSPMRTHAKTMVVWRVFEGLFRNGKVHQLGISNIYDLNELQRIWQEAEVKPAVIQNRFYSKTGYDRQLRQFCNENGIIYQSFWTLTANPEILHSHEILAISKKEKKTPEQIFFRYLIQQEGITPLSGTTNEQHMRDDVAVLDFQLSSEDLNTIQKLF